ncbi:MAG: efflux RND transporter periplasmic adaptor subunit [Bacteroidales bacterium]|jgi:membrane fusion protein (multidrug efflux system)|nr:efflux RND transporter periplasmic adaptor subunit [Bacteroidales bacterium]
MKKIIFIIVSVSILFSCSNNNDKKQIENEIVSNKKEIRKRENNIKKLQDKLTKISDNTADYKLPVKIKNIKEEKFNTYIKVNGSAEAMNSAFISPEANGQIKKIYVSEGDYVKKGSLLLSLNASVIDNNIKELETSLELAFKLYEKQKELWDQNIGSEIEYLQAKNKKEALENSLNTLHSQLEMSLIKAPFDGYIDEIFQKEGEMGSPGRQVLQMLSLSKMKINADISERYISKIQKGDLVNLSFPAYPEITKELKIRRVGNIVDNDSRTFKIEVRMNNIDNKIKPNLISLVKISVYTNDKAIVIPANIINEDIQGSYIYIVKKSQKMNIVNKIYIKTGISYNNQTEVIEGLNINDNVITIGYNNVSEGSEVVIKK